MMEWLKQFIKGLPLDKISEVVGEVVIWWGEQVKDIPADELPFQVYVGGSLIVCVLWYFVARMLPKPFGGMSWIITIAVLLTPGNSLEETGDIAPACVSVVYSILIKDYHGAALNFLPILMVIVGWFFLGFIWQLMREAIAQEKQEKQEKAAAKANDNRSESYDAETVTVTNKAPSLKQRLVKLKKAKFSKSES